MIESERVPGTRSDPEFIAVRTPAWEDPFTCRVRLPADLAGLNDFLTADWWNDRHGELALLGARVERVADGWFVGTSQGTESALSERTIVIAPPFPELLESSWAAADVPDFQQWVDQQVLGQVEGEAGAWRYDLTLAGDLGDSADQELGDRELFVWPGDPSTLTVTELLSAPHLPDFPDQPDFTTLADAVAPLARELWAQVEEADVIYRLSLVHHAFDAVAILRRATDTAVASRVSEATGEELRAKGKQLRASVLAAGWRLTGYADALLWPITAPADGEVPMDFVCDVALDLLRRAQVVPLPPAPDLAEWDRRLMELDKLRVAKGVEMNMILLHIGPHKTGTTTVQAAFHQNRERLAELGVHYAGARAHPMTAAMGAASKRGVPSMTADAGRVAWEGLLEEVHTAKEDAVVLSSEFFCEADDIRARAIVDALDADLVHVVITLRPLVNIISSQWQQYIQNRATPAYDDWLTGILSTPPSTTTPSFWQRHRHDELVARWAGVVGPERVTAIVLDEQDQGMLLRSFEDLLDIPPGTLVAHNVQANRSLTLAEVELMRAFNRRYAAERWSSADYTELIRFGAARQLQLRVPEATEGRLATPQWAIDRAVLLGAEMAQSIGASGINVIGSLDTLASPERLPLAGENADLDSVPDSVAASFLAGVVIHLGAVGGMPLAARRTQGPIEAAVRERHRRRRINTHLERTNQEIERLRNQSASRRTLRRIANRIRRARS